MPNGQETGLSALFKTLAGGVQGLQQGLQQQRQSQLQNLQSALQVQQAERQQQAFIQNQALTNQKIAESQAKVSKLERDKLGLATGKAPSSIEASISKLLFEGKSTDSPEVQELLRVKQELFKPEGVDLPPTLADLVSGFVPEVRERRETRSKSLLEAEKLGFEPGEAGFVGAPVDVNALFSTLLLPKLQELGIPPAQAIEALSPLFPSLGLADQPSVDVDLLKRQLDAGELRLEDLEDFEFDALEAAESGR